MQKEKEAQFQQAVELEREVIQTLQRVRQYEASIMQLRKNNGKCNITLKELSTVEEQKTYAPVGKCFIMKPKNDIVNDVSNLIKQNDKDIEDYDKLRQLLITKGKEKEAQLQEQMKNLRL
ncbi:hypothetical protein pb186bvf_021118 [Paramecium bursaria]